MAQSTADAWVWDEMRTTFDEDELDTFFARFATLEAPLEEVLTTATVPQHRER